MGTRQDYDDAIGWNLPLALSATGKRYARVLANASETKHQNEAMAGRQNEIRQIQEVPDFIG